MFKMSVELEYTCSSLGRDYCVVIASEFLLFLDILNSINQISKINICLVCRQQF